MFFLQFLLFLIAAVLQLLGAAVMVTAFTAWLFWSTLPGKKEIESFRLESTAGPGKIAWNDPKLRPLRIVVPLDSISPLLRTAVIISEDDLFYQHHGFNFEMLRMAVEKDLETNEYRYGASTITMQVAKNLFLTPEKTLVRKIKEALIAWRMEKILSKDRILEHYLNLAEWGEGIYGAEAASRYYFGKSAKDLGHAEATLLASLLPNPVYYNPFARLKPCQRKQQRVLRLLRLAHKMGAEEERSVLSAGVTLRGRPPAPSILENFPPATDSASAALPGAL